jgi:NAD(P)-dependent dehydrogenase (short-subunit alcohol dehydrogenase family)
METALLKGDTALVTGAGGGIGRAIAAALSEEGAEVFGADLREADLSKPGEPAGLAAEAVRRLGKVSIFVHAASPRRQEAQKTLQVTEAQWREMLDVNLNSAFVIAQALGNHMVEHAVKGRMLVITSLHAWSPRNLPHYSAAKAGQTMLVKELARALGPHGIRVNAIAPGLTDTAQPRYGNTEDELAVMASAVPLGHMAQPEDIARVAVFLASDDAAHMTGQTVHVNGGSFMP